jgi:Ca2+:H+ antiporter
LRVAVFCAVCRRVATQQCLKQMANPQHNAIPAWTFIATGLASCLLILKFANVIPADNVLVLVLADVLLGASVFAAVHHAELLAFKLGEPFGSILLAVSVTVIEAGLIISIMFSGAQGSGTVARDTIFSAVMIVLNGVVGLCLVIGGQRHFEQTFQLQGASSALAVLGTLATLALILPNYTLTTAGPFYSAAQLMFVGALSLALWCIFVFVQTVRHRDYFLDATDGEPAAAHEKPSDKVAFASLALLLVSLTAVVLLAKLLSAPLDSVIAALGLPQTFVGVIIAAIVLLPESLAAAKSALLNRLQNSINLSIGSAIASIGLTIPTVAIVAVMLDQKVELGISPSDVTLLMLTLFVSTLTLGTGRTTVLQGAVHLVIFAVFLLLSIVP